ncbi:hypothetical protein QO010_000275 [Caulobacter ginsengisoli]|uniref:Uncharacterized protein n=1 Tax=Caulobacter ginsengisoli TaxID=400775 RepID=A0ABU0INH9_9CAUL|nr:hypothetical protein [Caulobacter ginsengisoli]MDQ0462527.1 hypothetical protein [Caulobacter ginsengisoli]
MSAPARVTPTLEPSVAATFDVLSNEIELAGARCIFLDTLIGELMPTVPPEKRERLIVGMHAVDLLAQHLTSLSAFARRLGGDAPADAVAPVGPALADITLGDLADRMHVALGGEEAGLQDRSDPGDLDLF